MSTVTHCKSCSHISGAKACPQNHCVIASLQGQNGLFHSEYLAQGLGLGKGSARVCSMNMKDCYYSMWLRLPKCLCP